MSKAFDFSGANLNRIADEAQELELLFNDEPIGVFVSVRGFDSETFKESARREANAARRREFEAQRKGKNAQFRPLEEDEEAGIRLTAKLITAWRTVIDGKSKPVIFDNGNELECTPENVDQWLRTYGWVIPQINEFAGEVGNFTKNSSKASPPSQSTSSS